ncbi:MAG: glycosyltransferase family 2 protein [Paracoccaceae bacterium]
MTMSIVIPTFNRADLVTKAIDSALNQTLPCEVIVCDHGSTDNTPEVVRAYGNRVRYIRRAKDFGPLYCFLEGVMHSKGEFTSLLIDDDWLDPCFAERCLPLMKDDVGMCFGRAQIVNTSSDAKGELIYDGLAPKTGVHLVKTVEKRLRRTIITPVGVIYRRQIMLDALTVGRLPLQEHEFFCVGPDRMMTLLSMLRYPKMGFVNERVAYLGAHPGSITVDAHRKPEVLDAMMDAYQECDDYYLLMKRARPFREVLWAIRKLRRRFFGWRKPRS